MVFSVILFFVQFYIFDNCFFWLKFNIILNWFFFENRTNNSNFDFEKNFGTRKSIQILGQEFRFSELEFQEKWDSNLQIFGNTRIQILIIKVLEHWRMPKFQVSDFFELQKKWQNCRSESGFWNSSATGKSKFQTVIQKIPERWREGKRDFKLRHLENQIFRKLILRKFKIQIFWSPRSFFDGSWFYILLS